MVALADLVTRLADDAPAQAGTPSEAQYERLVRDAVADFGRRVPMRRTAEIATVPGQAAYDVPPGLVRLITVTPMSEAGSSDGRLVPFVAGMREQWSVQGVQLICTPTPRTVSTRTVIYGAGYALVDGDYADLTDEYAGIALLLAQARAWDLVAGAASVAAGSAVKEYSQGDVTVKRTGADVLAGAMRANAVQRTAAYEAAVARLVGAIGMRGGL